MESARRAAPADLPAAAAVLARVTAEMVGQRGGGVYLVREAVRGALPGASESDLAVVLADPAHIAVVGCYDGVVLGWATARIDTLADGRRLGVLDALVVDPEAREVGIGEAIMDLVLAELQAAGCLGVDAHALPGDRATKNFFESFGLKARLLTVHRSFDDGTDAEPA